MSLNCFGILVLPNSTLESLSAGSEHNGPIWWLYLGSLGILYFLFAWYLWPQIVARLQRGQKHFYDFVPLGSVKVMRADGRGLPLAWRTSREETVVRLMTVLLVRLSVPFAIIGGLSFLQMADQTAVEVGQVVVGYLFAWILLGIAGAGVALEIGSRDQTVRREVRIGADGLLIETRRGLFIPKRWRENIPIEDIAYLSVERLRALIGLVRNTIFLVCIETRNGRKIVLGGKPTELEANQLLEALHDRIFTSATYNRTPVEFEQEWGTPQQRTTPGIPQLQPPGLE